ncbi:PE family protein [Mycobacterium marinum]|uniref:PE family protein n=1 Tax=Mycobacterium marinum TaxID=1781 RepID=UPI003565173E
MRSVALHAQAYQAVSTQAAEFHDRFVAALTAGADADASSSAEASSAATLQSHAAVTAVGAGCGGGVAVKRRKRNRWRRRRRSGAAGSGGQSLPKHGNVCYHFASNCCAYGVVIADSVVSGA